MEPSDDALDSQGAVPPQSSMSLKQRKAQRAQFRAVASPRKRAVTACYNCRTRKTKCDNERPRCTACMKNGLGCSYDPRVDHSSFDPASLLILTKLSDLSQKLDELGGTQSRGGWQSPRNATSDLADHDSCLEVLSPYASTNFVLTWPVFDQCWPASLLSREMFNGTFGPCRTGPDGAGTATTSLVGQGPHVCEEDVPELIDRYLRYVYPKNPIFYARSIREHARRVSEDGFGWDAVSCLILLACALGAIASNFVPGYEIGQLHGRKSIDESAVRRRVAQVYFFAARKRIGLLEPSLIASQCHMLAGIYSMYMMRQLDGWHFIHQAGTILALYLRGQAAREGWPLSSTTEPAERLIEQRVYWTVLKSECEFRTELDLPQSELCKVEYPYAFPSPPDLTGPAEHESLPTPGPAASNDFSPGRGSTRMDLSSEATEEQSWFYYLSEIAMRRIENRVLNTFYKEPHQSWGELSVSTLIASTIAIEEQIHAWHSSLPEAIRLNGATHDENLDELRLVMASREQGVKACLYRPFLYIAIHSTPGAESGVRTVQDAYCAKALESCLWFTNGLCMTHRHHGTWYMQRWMVKSALMLSAAEKAGLISWRETDDVTSSLTRYGRALENCIESLRYWEDESPDLVKARAILEDIKASSQHNTCSSSTNESA